MQPSQDLDLASVVLLQPKIFTVSGNGSKIYLRSFRCASGQRATCMRTNPIDSKVRKSDRVKSISGSQDILQGCELFRQFSA